MFQYKDNILLIQQKQQGPIIKAGLEPRCSKKREHPVVQLSIWGENEDKQVLNNEIQIIQSTRQINSLFSED